MSNLNHIEINKVCRTCLTAAEDMKSLYEANSTTKQICLAELLMSCTPLKCFKTDDLPTTICRNCIRELNQCNTFQQKCLESEEILRNHVTGERNMYEKSLTTTILNQELDLVKNLIDVKIEIEDDYSPPVKPQGITDVSDIFNNLPNKTSELNSATLESLNQEHGRIKRDQDIDEENRIFEEVSVNTAFPVSLKNTNLVMSVQQNESLKDPLTIAEISEDMDQRLHLIKHEIDFQSINTNLIINCDGNTSKTSSVTVPVQIQPGEKLYSCTVCNSSYKFKKLLTSHMQKHLNEKPFMCSICNKSFGKKYILNMHLRTHTGEKPYTCTICNDTFRQSQHLKLHNLHMHTEEKPYPCTICDKSFKQKQQFTYHMRKHTGEKPYACTVCSVSFGQPQSLKIHMRAHTGEKPYPCTVCDSSFKQKSQFMYHMRSHTGEKPYPCTFCDRSFNTKQHLTSHMRTHTGEKPYSCTVCDMTFGHNHNLKLHMRTHTGEKPYTCTVCNNSYRQKQYFKTHMRSHT